MIRKGRFIKLTMYALGLGLLVAGIACSSAPTATPVPTSTPVPPPPTATPVPPPTPTATPLPPGVTPPPAPAATPTPRIVAIPTPTATPPPAVAAGKQPRYGGEFVGAHSGDPAHIDPVGSFATQYYEIWGNAYDNLVQYSPREPLGSIIPNLATSWEIGTDLKTYAFTMKQGVKWHDGKDFTIADAKWAVDILMSHGGHKAEMPAIEKVETVGTDTLVFRMSKPQVSVLQVMGLIFTPIAAKHVWDAADGDLKGGPTIGTGPFTAGKYTHGVSAILHRNPNYHGKSPYTGQQLPYLDSIKAIIIRSPETRYAAFQTGKVNWLGQSHAGVNREQVELLKRRVPGLKMTPFNKLQISTIQINTDAKPFDDVRVRQAVSLALDRFAALQVNENLDRPAPPIMVPGWGISDTEVLSMPGYGKGAEAVAKDRAAAKKLLTEAGYPDGFDATIHFLAPLDWMGKLAVYSIDQLSHVGIRLKSKGLPFAEGLNDWREKNFQLYTFGHNIAFPDPDANEKNVKPSPFNTLDDPKMAELFDAQAVELDLATRQKLVRELHERQFELMTIVPIGWQEGFLPVWPYVEDYLAPLGQWSRIRSQFVWFSEH